MCTENRCLGPSGRRGLGLSIIPTGVGIRRQIAGSSGKYSCDCRNIIAIITAGFDWTQCEDGPVEEIRAGRRDLVPAESASLARRRTDDIDDSYRHPGGTRWEEHKIGWKRSPTSSIWSILPSAATEVIPCGALPRHAEKPKGKFRVRRPQPLPERQSPQNPRFCRRLNSKTPSPAATPSPWKAGTPLWMWVPA